MRSLLLFALLAIGPLLRPDPVVAETVNISGLSNLNLPSFTGSGNLSDQDDICTYRSGGSNYSISASGSGASGAFTLSGAAGSVAYHALARDTVGSGSFVELETVNQLYNFTGASTTSTSCADSGGVNATVKITANESDLLAANAGNYSGSLTLVISPR